jgi:putative hemolysin
MIESTTLTPQPREPGTGAFSGGSPRLVTDARYLVKIAESAGEIESALRIRFDVFGSELGIELPFAADQYRLEKDRFDDHCRHLIVVERPTGLTVGTYRLNAIETARAIDGFYSYSEFTIEDLPPQVIEHGVEIGRACIAPAHRNTKVLFLLWKALANHLTRGGKRFVFGCCSIFTRDPAVGERAFRQLADAGHFHPAFRVEPRRNALYCGEPGSVDAANVELPSLFEMYLRIGARVCGPPTVDDDFGAIDFFVVFDLETIGPRYKKMFFS